MNNDGKKHDHKDDITAKSKQWQKEFYEMSDNEWQRQMAEYIANDDFEAVNEEIRRQFESLNAMY